MKAVYTWDENFAFSGIEIADENPEVKGEYLVPENCTDIAPLVSPAKWNGTKWVQDDIQAAITARSERTWRLVFSDWTILPDSPLTASQKTEAMQYRKQLRDITIQHGFPHNIEWPPVPNFLTSKQI